MRAYLDTSALLPYYRQEAASEEVEAFLSRQRQPLLLSRLTELEVASAIARWSRTGELTEPQANRIESAFHEDLGAGRYLRVDLSSAHFERANHWLPARKTALRTLDALHLACAEGNDAVLVTLDDALLQAAQWLGVRAQRPGAAPTGVGCD